MDDIQAWSASRRTWHRSEALSDRMLINTRIALSARRNLRLPDCRQRCPEGRSVLSWCGIHTRPESALADLRLFMQEERHTLEQTQLRLRLLPYCRACRTRIWKRSLKV